MFQGAYKLWVIYKQRYLHHVTPSTLVAYPLKLIGTRLPDMTVRKRALKQLGSQSLSVACWNQYLHQRVGSAELHL